MATQKTGGRRTTKQQQTKQESKPEETKVGITTQELQPTAPITVEQSEVHQTAGEEPQVEPEKANVEEGPKVEEASDGFNIPEHLESSMVRLKQFITTMNCKTANPSPKVVDDQLSYLHYYLEYILLQDMNEDINRERVEHTARLFREYYHNCFTDQLLNRSSNPTGYGPRASEGYLLFAAFSRLARHGKRANISWSAFTRIYNQRKAEPIRNNMRRVLAQ